MPLEDSGYFGILYCKQVPTWCRHLVISLDVLGSDDMHQWHCLDTDATSESPSLQRQYTLLLART